MILIKFIDLFAGIGGIRLGMEQAGHECVAFCEIDKFAKRSYKAIHDTTNEEEYDDITDISDAEWRKYKGTVDVVCGGFPCQAFSVAGKRKGFDDVRGTMFFYLANAVKQIEPRYFIFENVKGLLNHDKGRTFGTILNALDELGYDVEWHLYNSKDYGVPQNRERVYIVGHSRRYGRREILPFGRENGAVVGEDTLNVVRVGNVNPSGNGMNGNVYSDDGLSPTLTTNKGEGTKIMLSDNTIIDDTQEGFNGIKVYNGYAPTLRSSRYGLKVAEITKEEPKILIKEATKKGYAEASVGDSVGDSVNYSIPTSKTRRGRVGKGVANTLDTGCQQGVVVPALTPDRLVKRQNGRRFKEDGEPMFTINTQDRHGVLLGYKCLIDDTQTGFGSMRIYNDTSPTLRSSRFGLKALLEECTQLRIRKLTPLECWRLQGFPDELFYKAQAVNSNSQLYKQAGNSVTVNVAYDVAKHITNDWGRDY